MANLAIITARGGSKRIPKKNIKDFLGKPIIVYSIEAALNSNLFDEVMVSTDDEKIAAIAQEQGARVPFMRSADTADDYATTTDVLCEVMQTYQDQGQYYTTACCLYPTAPFVTAQKLRESYQRFEHYGYNALFPVVPFSSPVQRALRVDLEHRVSMIQPKQLNTRSQDLEPAYYDAGQFYWFRPDRLLAELKLLTDHTGVVIYSELEAQDIDQPDDWKLAELKYQLRHAEA